MVSKRSEYRRQFKLSNLEKNIPVYKDNVNYRMLRRERECAHTPISWDADWLDSESSDEKLSPDDEVDKLPVSEIEIVDEEEEDNVEREKKEAQQKDTQVEEKRRNDVEIIKQNEQLRKSSKEKLNKYVSLENKNVTRTLADGKMSDGKKVTMGKTFLKPKIVDDKLFVKRSKPRRPDRLCKVSKARPTSSPSKRPVSTSCHPRVEEKQPFVNYGGGGNVRTTGEQTTFNIRASSAVYPAALRALKRNQLMVEKQQEKQQSASAREKRKKALFNDRMAREKGTWETEYSRCFSAYQNTEYRVPSPDRSPRKLKSFFIT